MMWPRPIRRAMLARVRWYVRHSTVEHIARLKLPTMTAREAAQLALYIRKWGKGKALGGGVRMTVYALECPTHGVVRTFANGELLNAAAWSRCPMFGADGEVCGLLLGKLIDERQNA